MISLLWDGRGCLRSGQQEPFPGFSRGWLMCSDKLIRSCMILMRCPPHKIDGSLAETWLGRCMTAKRIGVEDSLRFSWHLCDVHACALCGIYEILLLTLDYLEPTNRYSEDDNVPLRSCRYVVVTSGGGVPRTMAPGSAGKVPTARRIVEREPSSILNLCVLRQNSQIDATEFERPIPVTQQCFLSGLNQGSPTSVRLCLS